MAVEHVTQGQVLLYIPNLIGTIDLLNSSNKVMQGLSCL